MIFYSTSLNIHNKLLRNYEMAVLLTLRLKPVLCDGITLQDRCADGTNILPLDELGTLFHTRSQNLELSELLRLKI